MFRLKSGLLALLLLLCGVVQVAAQPAPIKAGVYVAPPFIMKTANGYTGFTWDLWQQIARDLKLNYEVREAKTIAELLQLVISASPILIPACAS